jgi:hypothetical protein
MDINNENFQDYFGFGGYTRHRRSNLDFLNFSVEDTDAFKTLTAQFQRDNDNLRTEYFAKADALGFGEAVKAQKDAIYAELERKLKARNVRYQADVALLKANQGATRVQGGLNQFQEILDTLGIRRPEAQPTVVQVNQGGGSGSTQRNRTALYIVLGVVAIGAIGFVAYKMTK